MKPEKREKLQTVRNEMEAFMKEVFRSGWSMGLTENTEGIWSALTAMAVR